MRLPVSHGFLVRSSVSRLLAHALAAWALGAVLLIVLIVVFPTSVASVLYTAGAPGLAVLVAVHYFRSDAADEPLVTAFAFTAVAGVLDLIVAGGGRDESALLDPSFGFGLSLMLIFGVTGLAGELVPSPAGPRTR